MSKPRKAKVSSCFLSDEAMDATAEWLYYNLPSSIENKELIRGLYLIWEEELRRVIGHERERTWRWLLGDQGEN